MTFRRSRLFKIGLLGVLATAAQCAILSVGPGKAFATPCAAFSAAVAGDRIEIDAAGRYSGDVCVIEKNGLTIHGINGRPHIEAGGHAAAGKGIWVITGSDTLVENVELSGAAVPDRNGAGIWQEGRNLTVRHSYLHGNQNGIMILDSPQSQVLIEFTELAENGVGDGHTHNIYVHHVASFTMRYCYSHDANKGHLVKSRAARNYVYYNRLGDDAGGSTSYEVDLPNGGEAVLVGNFIEQGPHTANGAMVAYLEEGGRAGYPASTLYAANNTLVNNRGKDGIFFAVDPADTMPAFIRRNVFRGPGVLATQTNAILQSNVRIEGDTLGKLASGDYRWRDAWTFTRTGSEIEWAALMRMSHCVGDHARNPWCRALGYFGFKAPG